ncbi:MAG: triple tyrosine motif-containing protein [Pirellulaceae bacterium]
MTSLTRGGEPLDVNVDPARTREIRISWPDDHFEFQAAALSYSMPELNRYRYRLEGLHSEWIESGTGGGRYAKIPGGRYRLNIQACNSSGVWNETGTTLAVYVTPPFWKSQWFQTLMLLMGTLVSAGVLRYVEILRNEIRQRRTAESRLEISQARYRSIVEDQEDMIVRFDLDSKITFANRAYCEINDVSLEDVIGRHFGWRIHPDERDDIKKLVQAANQSIRCIPLNHELCGRMESTAWESWVGRTL